MRTWLTIIFCFNCTFIQGQTLTVVTEDWPTFNYQDDDGQIVGESTEHVREILEFANIPYNMYLYPWARSYHLAQTEPNTLIFTISKTKERQSLFHWFCPISKPTRISLYQLKESNIALTTVEDAKQYSIGVMRSDNSHELLNKMGFIDGEQLDVSSQEDANINKLFAQRVDLIVQSDDAIEYRLNKMDRSIESVEPLVMLHQLTEDSNCMALSVNSDPAVVSTLNKAFKQWRATQPQL